MAPPLFQSRQCLHPPTCLFLVVASLLGLYFPVLRLLAHDWSTDANYSHGFLIPLISGYMIYTLLRELRQIPLKPANWGALLLIAGLGQLYIAKAGSEFFLQRTSIIPVLLGITLFLFGKEIARKLLVPISYLIFMVPLPAILWNSIAFPMQLFSSAVTEVVIQYIGIPVFREGNVLHLSQTTLEVVDACSGLRSLTTMFALSAALTWFCRFAPWKKGVLLLSAAPIAIFANIIRLTCTAGLASVYGAQAAQGFLHEFSGIFTFMIGLILLVTTSRLLQAEFMGPTHKEQENR